VPLGAFVAMMDQSEEGREVLDLMQRSSLDIANQTFESDKVKIHLLRLVSENLQLPDELGTGMGIFLMPGIIHTYGVSQPVGGSGKLSESLVRCIEHYGGEVRCNAEVQRVLVGGGRATGVELASGEKIECAQARGAHHSRQLQSVRQSLRAARADQISNRRRRRQCRDARAALDQSARRAAR
jgi:phytoene dehydrogenase-like protein